MPPWKETAVDSAVAIGLLTEYFASRAAGFPPGPIAYQATFPAPADFESPRGVFLVACDDGDSRGVPELGCGGVRRVPEGENGGIRFEVKHLYLRPHLRGRGLGRALLNELETRARQFGATELVLDTNASLTAAAGLYHSAGFRSIEPYNDNQNATNWYGKLLA